MSRPKFHIARAQTILAASKRVLFVEGKDDEAVYAKWLFKIDPLFGNRLGIVVTDGRNDLDISLASLGHPIDAFAFRDRDEWDAARISSMQGANPRLLVNPNRHSIESYFCDPDELVTVLLAQDAAKYGPSETTLRAALSAPLADWVDHWSMWTTAMRLQSDMVSVGYSSYFHDILPLPPDPDVQSRLDSWSQLADSSRVWTSFLALRADERTKPTSEKHRSCVHGKKFWEQVVLPALRTVENRGDWLIDLADWSSIPPDLEPLLRSVLV
ncbi:MAG TPA: hypothetical protein VG097_08140 [Gemmata sp.]|jgi:hypothetical protein|nr:hypothetical protein [Gemmata sp.]